MYLLIDLESFVEFAVVPIFEVKRLNAGKSFEGFKSFQIFVDLKNSFFIVECRSSRVAQIPLSSRWSALGDSSAFQFEEIFYASENILRDLMGKIISRMRQDLNDILHAGGLYLDRRIVLTLLLYLFIYRFIVYC